MTSLSSEPEIASHKRPLRNWERVASVRSAPIRKLEPKKGALPFSPELLPIVNDARVKERGPSITYHLLGLKLLNYFSWTAQLEAEAVMPVCKAIGFNHLPWPVHPETALEALKIHTDEAHHTFFSEDIRHQAMALTGIRPANDRTPQFLTELARYHDGRDIRTKLLSLLMFVCVSETLISKSLITVPADLRVIEGVRLVIDDHAKDECRHHSFFSDVLPAVWQRFSLSERDIYGPMLATWLHVFLSPDYSNEERWLVTVGFSPEEASAIVHETHEAIDFPALCRDAGRPILTLLKKHGITAYAATYDAFAARRLIV
jgi:hypothetical protein